MTTTTLPNVRVHANDAQYCCHCSVLVPRGTTRVTHEWPANPLSFNFPRGRRFHFHVGCYSAANDGAPLPEGVSEEV